jgi:hypothetical protein
VEQKETSSRIAGKQEFVDMDDEDDESMDTDSGDGSINAAAIGTNNLSDDGNGNNQEKDDDASKTVEEVNNQFDGNPNDRRRKPKMKQKGDDLTTEEAQPKKGLG